MTRYLCWLALFAVAAVPDWATALCPPPLVYVAEPVAYPRQIILLAPCVPVYEVPLAPPRVDPPAKTPAASAAPQPTPPAATDTVRPAAAVEPARPAPPAAAPLPTPRAVTPPPAKVDPPELKLPLFHTPPAGPPTVAPAPTPVPPAPDTGSLIPPTPVRPAPPRFVVDPPAPPSDANSQPAPPGLRLPVPPADTPTPAKVDPPSLVLPSLTIPPPPGGVIAKSSPLSDATSHRPRVQSIPVMAAGPMPTGKRKVGFYNHSDRTLVLVVDGETTTLPRGYHLQAELPASFEFRLGTAPAERVTVPDGQAGVELLIRD